jgi:hypothetical protein
VKSRLRYHASVKRRLFNLANIVSMILVVLAAALLVRSLAAPEEWSVTRVTSDVNGIKGEYIWRTARVQLTSKHLLVEYLVQPCIYPSNSRWTVNHCTGENFPRGPTHDEFGLIHSVETYHDAEGYTGPSTTDQLVLPTWFVLLWLAACPVFSLVSKARWRHLEPVQNAICIRCGYDLRATPDRCPECGTVNLDAVPNDSG